MLTPKQEKFCQCIIKGMSQTDAYREALEISPRGQDVYRVITEDGEVRGVVSPYEGSKTVSSIHKYNK